MESGTITSASEALGRTDRSLRRLVRRIQESDLGVDEDLEREIRRARRQLRANQEVLVDETGSDTPAP